MGTAILSDLHLGVASGEDVLREPEIRRLLLEEIAGADRVVLLGDVVELRALALGAALDSTRPPPTRARPGSRGRESRSSAWSSKTSRERRAPAPRSTNGWARRDCGSPTPASGCGRTSTPPTATTWTRT